MPTPVRWLLLPALLVLGGVTGIASTALHQYWWGLALGVVTPALVLLALPPGWWARLPFALGWVAIIGYLTIPRPEGDYVIGSDTSGYALLVVACVFLVAGLVTLPRRVTPGAAAPPP